LFVANLSRFAQAVELDLSEYCGTTPVEAFGQTRFPPITRAPYLLTTGPHSFYFFALEPERNPAAAFPGTAEAALPSIEVESSEEVFLKEDRSHLTGVLLSFIRRSRWFGGKARTVQRALLKNLVPLAFRPATSHIALVQIEYTEGEPDIYVLPLGLAIGPKAEHLLRMFPQAAIARVQARGKRPTEETLIYDALWDGDFTGSLLHSIMRRRRFRADGDEVAAFPTPSLQAILPSGAPVPEPSVLQREQSNSTVVFGNRLIMKFFRRLEPGINPELEIGRVLDDQDFPNAPRLAGALEYRSPHKEPATLAILHQYIQNEGDAWQYTLDFLTSYFERALTARMGDSEKVLLNKSPVNLAAERLPPGAVEIMGPYLESARLLAERTAQLHRALAKPTDDPAMKPEPLTDLHRRAMYHSIAGQVDQKFQLLRERLNILPEDTRASALAVLERQGETARCARSILDHKIEAMRIRCHGDYHLGQVLYTGKDFVIIDFEGEPARLLGQRRIKHTPLRDVAGMLRSFHYAAHAHMIGSGASIRSEDAARLKEWARLWYACSGAVFLKSYLELTADASFLPHSREQLKILLDIAMLEKVIYELGYEMNNRPDWVRIPLEGILQLLEGYHGENVEVP
jgi:maltose alpha-D-glucosyltransferase/alpha-amylase